MPYKLKKKIGETACTFIEEIIDGMQDWVRVINNDSIIVFVNKSMRESLGMDITGMRCYEALGKTSPCLNCICKNNPSDWLTSKEEVINGRTFSVTCSPFKYGENGTEEAHIEVLHDITEIKEMSLELERQNERMKEDLLMAKRLQCSFLPINRPISEKIDFSFIYRPCETLGGDFLDIFRIDEDHIGIYIADVSGHGVAASMLTMFLKTALDKSQLSPTRALNQLYTDFNKNDFVNELYIAVFYAVLDINNYTLTYSNAGLNVCPILYSKDNFEILRAPGIPISNWLKNPDYVEMIINVKPKDKIFLYTDGIIEIKNKVNGQFGEERVVEHLLESTATPSQTLSQLLDKAMAFCDGNNNTNNILDDITIALMEIK